MISIEFPDKRVKEYSEKVTGYDIALDISEGLAKSSFAIEVNGELRDLSREIEKNSKIRLITSKNPESLEIIRHDAAHLLAQAAKELYGDEIQVTIGPVIENGFYYDFAGEKKLSEKDFEDLENKMTELSKKNLPITREVWKRDDAVSFFKDIGEDYKAEIIASIPAEQTITLYQQGNFKDLCRGPHAPSTGFVKHFKLTKLAGAYWRGDSNNEMLQRVYGTAWNTKKELADYLHRLEEAEKRDHRKIGNDLDLFHIQSEAKGQVFWHDRGWTVYVIIQNYIRKILEENEYKEINTPMLIDRVLWEKSGHWDKFQENMFTVNINNENEQEEVMAVKPMSCPAHIQIFNKKIRSYRDLPLKLAEFGCCHRNESSGSMHGLMRVRGFTQDDAHIFCQESQITEETKKFCELLLKAYKDFGFDEVTVKFSDRPDKRLGDDELWDKAENSLKSAVDSVGIETSLNKGEGAFYGPKLEFTLKDAIGREWQCGTLQVDFVLPRRLSAYYVDENGEKQHPVMLHRAILGTLERFIGILIEQYAGAFPMWLAPIQVAIIGVTNDFDEQVTQMFNKLKNQNIRVDMDISKNTIPSKIKKYSSLKIPQIWTIGDNEIKNNTVTIRYFGREKNIQETLSLNEAINNIKNSCS